MHPKSPSELYSEAVRLLNEQENSEEGLRYLKEAALRKYCEAENLFAIYLARESEDGLNERICAAEAQNIQGEHRN